MKKLFLPLMLLCLAACSTEPKADYVAEPANYVDPFIGTGGHGHTFPGATVPFGMVQFSPDTRMNDWDGCSGSSMRMKMPRQAIMPFSLMTIIQR